MSRADDASNTLFGILGLLAIKPWTTYELAKQFDRSLGRFLPRARSRLYEGPKRLVEMGYAKASTSTTGRRARTTYSITPKGRRALVAWLQEPGAGPQLEWEQLAKIFFADQASTDVVVTNLKAAQEWAWDQLPIHITVGRSYLEGTGPFPERTALLSIAGSYLVEHLLAVERWATWALGVVESWPDDPREAAPDMETHRENVRRLEEALARANAARARGDG